MKSNKTKILRTSGGKTCTKCKEFKSWGDFFRSKLKKDGYAYACKDCERKDRKIRYERNKEKYLAKGMERYELKRESILERQRKHERDYRYRRPPRDPLKESARAKLRQAVRLGKVVRGRCEVGDEECRGVIDGHHHDYSKPLDVRWLCRRHHLRLHRQSGKENLLPATPKHNSV